MNENLQLEQLRRMLMALEVKSGLYLVDTDLVDEEIESYIRKTSSFDAENLFTDAESVYDYQSVI